MMKKHSTVVVLLAIALLASTSFAGTITKVVLNVAVAGGVTANYDAAAKTLTWSAGASGLLIDADGNAYVDNNINVSGVFSDATDTSVAGQAMADFALDSVVFTFNSIEFDSLTGVPSTGVLVMSSYNSNRYWEKETLPDSDVLHGQALVNVAASFNLEPVWGSTHEVVWDGIDDVSLLDALISLPIGTNYQSYLTSYLSDNNMIVLNSVPEPCTLGLLGLGLVFIRRRSI